MRKGLFAFVVCALGFSSHAEDPKDAVHLEAASYEEAIQIAQKQERNLYLIFKGKWCSWCEKQDETLKDEKISRSMNGMVFYVVDLGSRRDLAKKYGVTSVPSHRFLAPDGKVIKSHVGYMDVDGVVDFLKP